MTHEVADATACLTTILFHARNGAPTGPTGLLHKGTQPLSEWRQWPNRSAVAASEAMLPTTLCKKVSTTWSATQPRLVRFSCSLRVQAHEMSTPNFPGLASDSAATNQHKLDGAATNHQKLDGDATKSIEHADSTATVGSSGDTQTPKDVTANVPTP